MTVRKVDLRQRVAAFGIPMSLVGPDDLDRVARRLFGILPREADAEAAIAAMSKKQRSRVARANARALITELRGAEAGRPTASDGPLTDAEAQAMADEVRRKCRASIRRMPDGYDRDRAIATMVLVFGQGSVSDLASSSSQN